jgi:hypothetical protein
MDILYRWSCPFVFHLIVSLLVRRGRGGEDGRGSEGTQKRSSQKNGPILGFLKYNQNYKAEVL